MHPLFPNLINTSIKIALDRAAKFGLIFRCRLQIESPANLNITSEQRATGENMALHHVPWGGALDGFFTTPLRWGKAAPTLCVYE